MIEGTHLNVLIGHREGICLLLLLLACSELYDALNFISFNALAQRCHGLFASDIECVWVMMCCVDNDKYM